MTKRWRPVLSDFTVTALDSYLWVLWSDADQKIHGCEMNSCVNFSELTRKNRKKSPFKINSKDSTEGCLRLFHIITHDDENE